VAFRNGCGAERTARALRGRQRLYRLPAPDARGRVRAGIGPAGGRGRPPPQPSPLTMDLVKAALRNPHAVIVGVLLVAVLGTVAALRLPTDLLPQFKTPAVQVLTLYPGMPAEIVEKDMTTRLERWTGQSNGIEHQESRSMLGVSIVRDYFQPD